MKPCHMLSRTLSTLTTGDLEEIDTGNFVLDPTEPGMSFGSLLMTA